MVRKLASAIIVASALNAAQVNALGLGELQLHSALNEPLNAEIKLLNVGDLSDNQILVKLANRDDFEKSGVERSFFLTNFKFSVQVDGKGNGVVKIKTRRLVNEPYLNFVVEAKWPAGRLLREYTSLLDLPIYAEETTSTTVNLGTTTAANGRNVQGAQSEVKRETQLPVPKQGVPARAASSASRYDGESYQIAKNDTLWSIAARVRPSGNVSIQQTMVALQQLNPEAFISNNINLLKAGHVLRVPDEQLVQDINVRYAMREVAAQNKAWQGTKLGAQVDATSRGAEPTQRVEREGGRLSLNSAATSVAAGADAGGSGDVAALQNKLAESEEGLDKADRDNEDLRSELSEVQAQLETLQRLVELKDDQLAALQGNVAKNDSETVTGELPAEVAGEIVGDEEEKIAPDDAGSLEIADAAAAKTAEPEAKKIPEIKKPVVTMKPSTEKGLLGQLMENPLYLGGALLALLLLIAGTIIKRRSSSADESDVVIDETFVEGEAEFDEVFEEASDEFDEVESEPVEEEKLLEEESAPAQSETGDAIGEADIYVAYGRFQHAIDLLKNAISSEEQRTDLRLKLLEVYLESGDKEGFQQQFTELQALSDQGATGQAKDMLSTVDGASDWLDDVAENIDSDEDAFGSFDEQAEQQDDDLVLDDTELDLGVLDDDLETEDSRDKAIEYDTNDLGLDLDLDSDIDELDISADLESEDITDGLDDDGIVSVEKSFSLDTVEEEPVDELDDLDDLGGLDDLDLDLGTEEVAITDDGLDLDLETENAVDTSDEFDLDIGEGFDLEEADETVVNETADLDLDDDLESFDAEDLDAAADAESGEGAGDASEDAGSLDDEFEFLSDADEIATKLDLARAYIDMGDVDGAKDILDEVLQEGEEAQKAEANSLLERIG